MRNSFVEICERSVLRELNTEKSLGILTIESSFEKQIIESNFLDYIYPIFAKITNTDFGVIIFSDDEYKLSQSNPEKGDEYIEENAYISDNLNPYFQFDNFLVSKSNRMLFNAAMAVGSKPGGE
jgi:chromosomal replication initiation ATPase DnaA